MIQFAASLLTDEDQGYLAAEAGQRLVDNPHPYATIRYSDWQRGWQIKCDETRRTPRLGGGTGQDDEGYLAAEAGYGLSENPYPNGTIRHEDWRRGWRMKNDEIRRAVRLGRDKARSP
jgi:hypothetical protein